MSPSSAAHKRSWTLSSGLTGRSRSSRQRFASSRYFSGVFMATAEVSPLRSDSRQLVSKNFVETEREQCDHGCARMARPRRVRVLCTRAPREDLGGCESADHPKLPVRSRVTYVLNRLFGSGSAGLGIVSSKERTMSEGDNHPISATAVDFGMDGPD